MNPNTESPHLFLKNGIRLIALFWLSFGLWLWIARSVEFFYDFDPNYWSDFFLTQWFRPLLAIFLGTSLLFLSNKIARWLS